MGIVVLKIRRSRDRLIFNTGILILVRRHLYIVTGPWFIIENIFPGTGISVMKMGWSAGDCPPLRKDFNYLCRFIMKKWYSNWIRNDSNWILRFIKIERKMSNHCVLMKPSRVLDLCNIVSGNGLSTVWHQAIIWANADLLSIGPLRTNFGEIAIKAREFWFGTMHLKNRRQNVALQRRHNGRHGVSNHQPHHCYLTVYSNADQRKHQSSASLAFVRGIHRWPVNSHTKGQWRGKYFPFNDVIM